jgi:uncharacterized protein YwbE
VALLFDRRCRLLVSTTTDTPNDFKTVTDNVTEINGGKTSDKQRPGLRIKFTATKTLKKEPNTAEISVFNLSKETRSKLHGHGVKVFIEAGYAGKAGLFRVFSGDVRTVDHVRNGPDWETVFKCGDGERAFQYARINESFAEGTPLPKAVEKIVNKMGIGSGNLQKELGKLSGTLNQGFAASGSTARALDQILKSVRKTWSVQDGEFQILDRDATLDETVSIISSSSGMVDSPEMGKPDKKKGPSKVAIKSLLIPMKPGRRVKLESDRYNGLVRVVSCTFSGDTHGGDWYTEIQGTLIK